MDTIIMDTASITTKLRHNETAMESGEIANVFTAGHMARPGDYRHLESGLVVHLEADDYLPASLDGQVACYVLINSTVLQSSVDAREENDANKNDLKRDAALANDPFEIDKEKGKNS